jgi:hypothetical protein
VRKWAAAALVAVSLVALAVLISPTAEGITISGFFTDDDGNTFEGDIEAIANVGITRGCNPPGNTLYCPDDEVTRGEMAAFIRRALRLPYVSTDYFSDDGNSIFEDDINAVAEVGITRGCDPPVNDRFCPDDEVDRGQMAAFLRRALQLPPISTNYFGDDDSSTFEADINAIAGEGITRGCDPPANTLFCPTRDVTRGEMAAFLRRSLDLPDVIRKIPVGSHSAMICSKDGQSCSLTVDLTANRAYRIREGVYQANPASSTEDNRFNSSATTFTLTLGGSNVSMSEIPRQTSGGVTSRLWNREISFSSGTHTLVGRWRWNGTLIQTNTITIRASG